jgi:hypothetical protein
MRHFPAAGKLSFRTFRSRNAQPNSYPAMGATQAFASTSVLGTSGGSLTSGMGGKRTLGTAPPPLATSAVGSSPPEAVRSG